MREWWGSLGRAQRVVGSVVAVIVAVNVVLAALGDVVPKSPSGPASSSFATAPDGLAAYADLLERSGHDVTRLGRRIGPADLPPGATAVIADPQELTESEGAALGRFLADGGRLVVAGTNTELLVEVYTGIPVAVGSVDEESDVQVWVPSPYTGDASTVVGSGTDRWTGIGPMLPLAGADGRPTLVTTAVGEGRLLALVDAGPLSNRNLAFGDNATLGLSLAGPGRPVVFVESAHGYAEGGLGAVPTGWKWAAAGLVVALLLGLWSAGTRFGPPEPSRRALRPPRSDHVDAVAATMQRGVDGPADLVDPFTGDEPDPDSAEDGVDTLADALAVGSAAAERRRRSHAGTANPAAPPNAPTRTDHTGADQ